MTNSKTIRRASALAVVLLATFSTALSISAAPEPASTIVTREYRVTIPGDDATVRLNYDNATASAECVISRTGQPDHVYRYTNVPMRLTVAFGESVVLSVEGDLPEGTRLGFLGGQTTYSELNADPAHYQSEPVVRTRDALAADLAILATLRSHTKIAELFDAACRIATGSETGTADRNAAVSEISSNTVAVASDLSMSCYFNCRFWGHAACPCWLGCGGNQDSVGSPCPRSGQPMIY